MKSKSRRSSILVYAIAFVALAGSTVSSAYGEEEEEQSLNAGEGKAVLKADIKSGFQLSQRAREIAEVKTSKIASLEPITVPLSAVVYFQDFTGVYRERGGWYKLVEVDLIKQTAENASFFSKDFKENDRIVLTGVAYLRATDMDLWGPQSDSCLAQ